MIFLYILGWMLIGVFVQVFADAYADYPLFDSIDITLGQVILGAFACVIWPIIFIITLWIILDDKFVVYRRKR